MARLAGVSQATVSYVLTGRDAPLSAETCRRVQDALVELGYAPNALARGLRGAPTALFGVIARQISQPLQTTMIEVLGDEARSRGYEVLVANTGESTPEVLNLIALMRSQLCDGVVLLGDVPHDELLWDGYNEIGFPAVGLFQGSRELPIPNISVDNVQGTRLALEHLEGLGHSRIAFIGSGWIHGSQDRLSAFEQFRAAHALCDNPDYVVLTDGSATDGQEACDRLLALAEPPTAIFAATDLVAMGVLSRAAQLGIEVPRQLSVVGFDDAPQTAYLVPALTTVRQPIEKMARMAIAILSGNEPQDTADRVSVVAPWLVVRSSTEVLRA